MRYRRIDSNKRDDVQEIKQDSKIRIIVLCTKLGIKQELISKVLKITKKEIKEELGKAIRGELIKEEELQGIRILEDPLSDFKEKSK